MSTNWNKVQQIKRVEITANGLGFELTSGRDTWTDQGGALIYLVPLDDKFPHYSRGAEIYQGTIEDIDIWLKGLEWARTYDMMLRISNDKKRNEREQVERNRQLMKMVKTGKKVSGDIGSDITPYEIGVEGVDYDEIPF